jgi:hypothetical protein
MNAKKILGLMGVMGTMGLIASAQTNIIISFTNQNGIVSNAMLLRIENGKAIYKLEGGGGGVVPITDLPEYWAKKFGALEEKQKAMTLKFIPQPLYVPTPEQKKFEGSKFFLTQLDEFDRKVKHQLLNFYELEDSPFYTFVEREYGPGERSSYFMVVGISEPAEIGDGHRFDGRGKLKFVVDENRFEIKDQAVTPQITSRLRLKQYFGCNVPEDLLRQLGSAKKAAVRVPCRDGKSYTHDYSALELKRFEIFARVFMPPLPESATNGLAGVRVTP